MAATNGVSVLPARTTRRPERSSMSATRVTTVVLPFVPVTAYRGRSSQRKARSDSSSTATPAVRAAAKTGWRSGTPGAITTSLTCPTSSGHELGRGASTNSIPKRTAQARASSPGASSTARLSISRRVSASKAARPATPSPRTSTRLLTGRSCRSPQWRWSRHRKYQDQLPYTGRT